MKTVLIVDDSRTFQRILEQILKPHFIVVAKANSADEGFEFYKTYKPDLVLMDITMPGRSGKECLQQIISFDRKARVLMVSSLGDDSTIDSCIALGAQGFVPKNQISATDQSDSKLVKAAQNAVNGSQIPEIL